MCNNEVTVHKTGSHRNVCTMLIARNKYTFPPCSGIEQIPDVRYKSRQMEICIKSLLPYVHYVQVVEKEKKRKLNDHVTTRSHEIWRYLRPAFKAA